MNPYLLSIDGQEIGVYANSSAEAEDFAWEQYPKARRIAVVGGGRQRAFELDASAKVGNPNTQVYNPDYYKQGKLNSRNRFKN